MELTTEILQARGYKYDFATDANDQPCHSFHKNGLTLRDLGDGLFEVKGEEIDTVEELETIEKDREKDKAHSFTYGKGINPEAVPALIEAVDVLLAAMDEPVIPSATHASKLLAIAALKKAKNL
jgi:hypothetical protein